MVGIVFTVVLIFLLFVLKILNDRHEATGKGEKFKTSFHTNVETATYVIAGILLFIILLIPMITNFFKK
jgi:heme/copper-type cytochrome/quinol oxidase subunit 2